MSTLANLVINDGQATPVAHTFNPAYQTAELVKWVDRSGQIVAAFPEISLGRRYANKQRAATKETLKVVVPVLENTSPSTTTGIPPAPTVAYEILFNLEVVRPTRTDQAKMNDAFAFFANALSNALIKGELKDSDIIM